MNYKNAKGRIQASVLTVAIALSGIATQPVAAKPGGFKPTFNAAAKGGAKAVKPVRPGGAGKAGGFKRPGGVKKPSTKPNVRPMPKKVTRPHGKPKMNPGLPKPRQKPVTMGSRTSGQLKGQFNKAAQKKPLRDIFNPAARPPVKPVKGDPPPVPALKPPMPKF